MKEKSTLKQLKAYSMLETCKILEVNFSSDMLIKPEEISQ